MNEIRQWVLSICAAALLGQLLCMLMPKFKQNGPFKTTLNLFVVCILVSPLNGGINLGFETDSGMFSPEIRENRLKEETDRQFYDLVSQNISGSIETKLDAIQVKAKKINVNMDTSVKDSISISKIEIVLEGGMKIREADIVSEVKKATGVTPEIRYAGE